VKTQLQLNMVFLNGILKMDLEPIADIIEGTAEILVESSESPKGCILKMFILLAIVGIIALIIYLL